MFLLAAANDPFHHVRDLDHFEFPGFNVPLGFITRYMLLQVVAGLLVLWVFHGLAKRIRGGKPVTGVFWNFWESLYLAIRDQVVRPTFAEGHHEDDHGDGHSHQQPGDKYLPLILTLFFYILFMNLLGAVPWFGTPTADLNVTAVLAISVLVCTFIAGFSVSGPVGFFKALVPDLGMKGPGMVLMTVILFPIEVMGLLIKHGVLALRLFANMLAGHTVLAVFLGFILTAARFANEGGYIMATTITTASIFAQLAIAFLELLVAFIQAYVFAFLATLFIATAEHPH